VLGLLRDLQASGAVGMRVEQDKARGETAVLFFGQDNLSPDLVAKVAEVRRLLKLPPDQQRYVLTYSPAPGAGNRLAVNSRSLLQILTAAASYVDAPAADVANHSALASIQSPDDGEDAIRIRSGDRKPKNGFAAVRYRDHWFWIDDGDWRTKRALTALMFFFTLIEGTGAEKLPLITIPAQ